MYHIVYFHDIIIMQAPFGANTFNAESMMSELAPMLLQFWFCTFPRSIVRNCKVSATFSFMDMNSSVSTARMANPICWSYTHKTESTAY